jgi:hypothetical protein
MIASRLLHKDFFSFSEFSIEICTLDVNLMKFHVLSSSHSYNSLDQGKLHDGSKSVKIVNTRYLQESLGNKMCFVMDYVSSSIFLSMENPFEPTMLVCAGASVNSQVPVSCNSANSS